MTLRTVQDDRDFDVSLDHAIDLAAVLQAALEVADPDGKRSRFEVVAALVATMATVAATLDDETFAYAIEAVRAADLIVLGLRHADNFPRSRLSDTARTRAVLKEAFWRARAPSKQ